MNVSRRTEDQKALIILNVDSEINDKVVEQLKKVPEVLKLKTIRL